MIDPQTATYGAFLIRVGLGVMYLAHSLVLKGLAKIRSRRLSSYNLA